MFEEMKLHTILHKATTGDPTFITPAQTLACATANGARAQGRQDCGCIKQNNKADLVIIDMNTPNMRPSHNALNNLIYATTGGEVIMTLVDGSVLYREGKWLSIDVDHVRSRVEASRIRILRELGL
jgi:5-methylthioadenosine/S-adenosylhomocysteine deaminase